MHERQMKEIAADDLRGWLKRCFGRSLTKHARPSGPWTVSWT